MAPVIAHVAIKTPDTRTEPKTRDTTAPMSLTIGFWVVAAKKTHTRRPIARRRNIVARKQIAK
jgi:hypothetical protein